MVHKSRIVFSFLLILIGAGLCQGQSTFYVANGGSNGGLGTAADPWETIQFAVDLADPGDTIIVQSGVYSEMVTFSGVADSGTAGNFISLKGDGLPVIDGSAFTPSGRQGLVTISGASYLNIEGFEIRNFQTPDPVEFDPNEPIGILVQGNSTNLQIRDNKIHDIKNHSSCAEGDVVSGDDCAPGANGIAVYGDTVDGISDITFVGNEVYQCVTSSSEVFTLNGNISGFTIANNNVHDNNNIGLDFIGFEADTCPACGDSNQARNGLVRANTATNNSVLGGPNHDSNPWYQGSVIANEGNAAGFYVDGGRYIIFDSNTSSGNDLGFEFGSENRFRATEDILMINNVVFDNKENGVISGGYSSVEDDPNGGGGDASRIYIFNNTFYHNKGWGSEIVFQHRVKDSRVANNIFWGEASVEENFEEYGGSSNTNNAWAINLWWGANTGGQGNLPGTSIVQDPLLLDPSIGIFDIGSSSPAKDTGSPENNFNWSDPYWSELFPPSGSILASGSVDHRGNDRVQSQIDIGAIEYTGSLALRIDLRLLLQGAFSGSDMQQELGDKGIIPLTHPYSDAPWNQASETAPVMPSKGRGGLDSGRALLWGCGQCYAQFGRKSTSLSAFQWRCRRLLGE